MTVIATVTGDRALTLGEGPFWDAARDRVLCVDIAAGVVRAGSLHDGRVALEVVAAVESQTVGAAVPAADGGLLVAGEHGLLAVGPDGRTSVGPRLVPEGVDSRLNDGACDPAGRFLVGSMARDGRTGAECLHRLDDDGVVRPVVEGLTLSNGLAWSPDGATMYLADTVPGRIRAYDYDVGSGRVGDSRTVLEDADLDPDGLCVDALGRLWVAFYGRGEVRCLTPDGEVVERVQVDAPRTTSVAFVGPGLDRLLVTTAQEGMGADELAQHPLSGRLFLADVQVTGLPVPGWSGNAAEPPWA
jgi:sugar lactone lactonase YvrE